MNKYLKIVLALLVIGGVGSIYVYKNIYNKPHVNINNSQVDFIVTPDELIDDFKDNEQEANKKYLDKIIQINGVVHKIDMTNGLSTLTFKNGNSLESVICNMDPGENEKISKLETGETIQAKGICTGYLLDVVIVRAVLVDQNM